MHEATVPESFAYIVEPASLAPDLHIRTLRIISIAISQPRLDLPRERLMRDLGFPIKNCLKLDRNMMGQ